jgi:translocation and assembly module TamA
MEAACSRWDHRPFRRSPSIQDCTVRLGLLALLVTLLGLPIGAPAQPAVPEDDSVRLVTVAGVTGTVATALEDTLARFRLAPEADEADEERELRRAERAAAEVLATEGYFSPRVRFEPNPAGTPRYRLVVDAGRLTRVTAVEIAAALAEPAFRARGRSAERLPAVGARFARRLGDR